MSNGAVESPFQTAQKALSCLHEKEGGYWSVEQELQMLLRENQQLKKDNEAMLNIIAQMKITLNRLISQYMTYSEEALEK